jgi:hypothetical protein
MLPRYFPPDLADNRRERTGVVKVGAVTAPVNEAWQRSLPAPFHGVVAPHGQQSAGPDYPRLCRDDHVVISQIVKSTDENTSSESGTNCGCAGMIFVGPSIAFIGIGGDLIILVRIGGRNCRVHPAMSLVRSVEAGRLLAW